MFSQPYSGTYSLIEEPPEPPSTRPVPAKMPENLVVFKVGKGVGNVLTIIYFNGL